MRIGSLAGLRLDRNLHRSRGRGVLLISLLEQDMKNSQPLEYEVNAESAKRIEVYIKHFLPLLTKDQPAFLFPGRDGGSKDPGTLGKQVSRLIREHLGLDVNPHLFRHIGGGKLLERYPAATNRSADISGMLPARPHTGIIQALKRCRHIGCSTIW